MARKHKIKLKLKPETVFSVVGVILISIGLLVIVSFTGQGWLLKFFNDLLARTLGSSALLLPFFFIASGMVMFQSKWHWSKPHVLLGTAFILIGYAGFFRTGSIGAELHSNMARFIAPAGSYVLFMTALVAGWLIMLQLSVPEVLEAIQTFWPKLPEKPVKKDELDFSDDDSKEGKTWLSLPKLSLPFGKGSKVATGGARDFVVHDGELAKGAATSMVANQTGSLASATPGASHLLASSPSPSTTGSDHLPKLSTDPKDIGKRSSLVPNASKLVWEYPPLSILSASEGGEANRGDINQNADTIESTLASFGVKSKVKEVNRGPSVTQYALEIAQGTKLSRITGLSTDLAMALAAPTGQIRIEAPIAGRSLVGVEVPNYSAQYVTLRKMLSLKNAKQKKAQLAVSLGIDVAGQPVFADISEMPHILIAGATGSGKSVCINTIMCSILFQASPAEVKFILVDPKRVELTAYNGIPHLLVPVIVDPKKVVSALKWATVEMEDRYKKLAEVGVKHIDMYNELAGHAAMSKIVIVIDELADIMLISPAEVEESITRIAQMARAVGIHLVLATQRPSVDVITGLIKANVPARIAFNVSSMTDSRVILDAPGAEKLLGKGDMLFVPPDRAKPMRVQGTYVSEIEIQDLIKFVKSQGSEPDYEEEITSKYKSTGIKGVQSIADGDERDEMFDEVAQYVLKSGKASSSSIQRRYSVGYNRAARIVDQLHAAGLVGEAQGSKPREINQQGLLEYLRNLQSVDQA